MIKEVSIYIDEFQQRKPPQQAKPYTYADKRSRIITPKIRTLQAPEAQDNFEGAVAVGRARRHSSTNHSKRITL